MVMELEVLGEGDHIKSPDHCFSQIGEPLPIGGGGNIYDSECPPAHPLAVSQRYGLLFVAHPNGFYAARTKEVKAAAEAFKKNKDSGLSVEKLTRTLDISSIGRVSILALSSLDSWLAASVDHHINFFSMSALRHGDVHASFSVDLDQSVKDIKWAPQAALERHYLALSTAGTLYHGSGPASPDTLRTDVDSAEWSPNGDFIAVAQDNIITLLFSPKFEESKFEEKTSFSLSPASIIVDSIRWVSAGKIILGCFDQEDDPDQPTYIVQVISTHDKDITNISSKPSMVVFNDMFLNYQSDVAPSATGPSLFVSYLENCELAIVANRKNLLEHVVLLGEDKNREAATIELVNDAWRPSIFTQENGDDNLVLALSVDKVSHDHDDEKKKFILGEPQIEVLSCRILLCVTVDGKIHLFHFASAADSNSSESDGKQDKHQVLSENRLEQNTLHSSPAQEHDGLSYSKPYAGSVSNTQSSSINSIKIKENSSFGSQTHDSAFSFQEARDDTQPSELAKYPISHAEHSPSKDSVMKARGDVWKTETPAISEAKAQADVVLAKLPTDISSQSVSKSIPAPTGTATLSSSLRNSFPLRASDDRSTSSLSFGAVSQSPSRSEETSAPAARLSFPGMKAAALVDNRSSSPANHNSQILSQQNKASGKFIRDENIIATSYPERSNHEQQLSSQFSNVEVLVHKMDQLLEDIQGCGGFMDASITSQEGSVAALEEGLSMMSEKCGMWRGTLGERLKETQILLDKTVQVRAREVYVEGILRQANDNGYSVLWNSQKLGLELDLKRQHIIEVDRELASQLVELERHFNAIEFNKVGEGKVFKPRQQHLRSLQDTMSAQLFAAEKLSERLSEQMAALNLPSQDSKQNAKREVFETLGLPYDGAYNSSVKGKASDSPRKDLMMNSSSITAKYVCSTNLYTPVKNSEPQTVRRQRKSLEQLKFSPVCEKVTLKRILLQGDHIKCENRLGTETKDLNLRRVSPVSYDFSEASEKSKFHYRSKNSSKIPAKQFNEGFSTPSSHWTEEVAGRRIEDVSAKSPETYNTRIYGSEKNHTKSWKLAGKASGSDAEYAQESENPPSDIPSSIGERTPVSMSSASNGLGTFRSAIGEVKTTPVHEFHVPDSIFSQSASVSSGFSSPLFSSSRVLETEVAAGEIRPGQKISFPVLQSNTSASNQVSSSATSTPSPNMTAGLKSHDTDLSSSSHTDQKKLQSHSLFSSYSSQYPEKVNHSSGTPNFLKESSEIPESGSQPTEDVYGTSRSDDSSVKQKSISSSSLAREEMPKAEASVLLHEIPNASSSSLSSVSEISSTQANESTQAQANGTQPNLEVPASEMKPNSTHGQSRNNSLAPIPSGTLLVGEDMANNEEDEMEEEAPESSLTPELTLGNLGGFGFGSSSSSSDTSKPNPFGVGMINNSAAPVAMTTQAGELFRPASFNIQSAFPSQPSIAANTSLFSSGFGSGSSSLGPPSSGFGQPAQFGSGQQALGSVLGAFGQSRQLGASPPGNSIAPTSGGFSSLGSGGFGAAATVGGGFAAVTGGGFAAAAGTARGGFAAAAGTGGGGFAAAAGTGTGSFAAASTGGGFAAAGGTFGNPVRGFSAFGNSSGAGGPPANLFTEMRK